MRSDARNAFIMTLKDGGNAKEVHLGRQPGRYTNADGIQVEQRMDIENRVKVAGGRLGEYELKWETKGLKTILEERGLWPRDKGLKLEDAQNLLNMQPDFQDQMEWLEETVRKHRGLKNEEYYVFFYPKFHPEFNPIERIWGAGKHRLREECKNDFSWLVENFPKFLKEIPLHQIQRYFRGARRYWDAYREKIRYDEYGRQIGVGIFLTPSQIDFAVKLFRSHRGIPNTILKMLEDREEEAAVFGYDPLPRSGVDHNHELNWELQEVALAVPAGEEDLQARLNSIRFCSADTRNERRERHREEIMAGAAAAAAVPAAAAVIPAPPKKKRKVASSDSIPGVVEIYVAASAVQDQRDGPVEASGEASPVDEAAASASVKPIRGGKRPRAPAAAVMGEATGTRKSTRNAATVANLKRAFGAGYDTDPEDSS